MRGAVGLSVGLWFVSGDRGESDCLCYSPERGGKPPSLFPRVPNTCPGLSDGRRCDSSSATGEETECCLDMGRVKQRGNEERAVVFLL